MCNVNLPWFKFVFFFFKNKKKRCFGFKGIVNDVVRAKFDGRARNVPSPPNHGHATCVIGLRRSQINPKPSKGVLALTSENHVSPNWLYRYVDTPHLPINYKSLFLVKAIQPDSIPISTPPPTYLYYPKPQYNPVSNP